MGTVKGKEFLPKNIKRFFSCLYPAEGRSVRVHSVFVVNSFHKVANFYSLLEFSLDRNPLEWLWHCMKAKGDEVTL